MTFDRTLSLPLHGSSNYAAVPGCCSRRTTTPHRQNLGNPVSHKVQTSTKSDRRLEAEGRSFDVIVDPLSSQRVTGSRQRRGLHTSDQSQETLLTTNVTLRQQMASGIRLLRLLLVCACISLCFASQCSNNTHNCDLNALCSDTNASFTCVCNTGYSGDGVTCDNVDECGMGSDNCHSVALCGDTPGSFICQCMGDGYTGNGVDCANLDECALGSHNCHTEATCSDTNGSFTCGCLPGYVTVDDGVNCDAHECLLGLDTCHPFADCTNTMGSFECTCGGTTEGDGVSCRGAACEESMARMCHATAYCAQTDEARSHNCICPPGSVGDGLKRELGGSECNRESWSVQVTLDLGEPDSLPVLAGAQGFPVLSQNRERLYYWQRDCPAFGDMFFPPSGADTIRRNLYAEKPDWFDGSMVHSVTDSRFLTVHALFMTKAEAENGLYWYMNNTDSSPPSQVFNTAAQPGVPLTRDTLTATPRVLPFVSPTSEAEVRVLPTGMDVENVYFLSSCLSSGCWVIDLVYTSGEDAFNSFYIPRAVGNNSLGTNFDYTVIPDYGVPYGKSPADTFFPVNFPCGSDGYKYKKSASEDIPDQVSACCLEEFITMYRPVDTLERDPRVQPVLGDSRESWCGNGTVRPVWNSTFSPQSALHGNFSGMDGLAYVSFTGVRDPYLMQYSASVYLDANALRQKAAIFSGDVSISYGVETFIGFANFKPTNLEFLDSFAAHTRVRMEKTNFFTLALYGENDLTFLEYVNLRLVTVYEEQRYAESQPFEFNEYHLTTELGPYPESPARGDTVLDSASRVWITNHAQGGYEVFYNLVGLAAAETSGGLHVHAGTSCESHEQVLGHFFATPTDPWTTVWTKAAGATTAQGSVRVQSPGFPLETNNHHAFVVHEEDGERIACGILYDIGGSIARTSPHNSADYLQVTFTLGAQYQPIETGAVPMDSVLVSKGDFFESPGTHETRFPACQQYHDGSFPRLNQFKSRFATPDNTHRRCAPNATMCYSPPYIADQFVHINIPLGIDWLPAPSNNLDSNVFVDLVVSVIDAQQIAVPAGNPNLGDKAEQVKTTLKASIPVVEGGQYIFCDQITVVQDLFDVANADLILGSAGVLAGWERLWIGEDIATTPFDTGNGTRIDSDSIEAGLMTLVLKGDPDYFEQFPDLSLELEDCITLHIMEPGTSMLSSVLNLINTPFDQVDLTNEGGFPLNGAFRFEIVDELARLQPTQALVSLCPFSPRPPTDQDAFPATCVARRDVEARIFPALPGKNYTACELPATNFSVDAQERTVAADFMQIMLNPSEYSINLGRNFSKIIGEKYDLNGRYNRAYWINPGYEWTPALTGGQSPFTLSQSIIMAVLINLDDAATGSRRRMLLQSSTVQKPDGGGVSTQRMSFQTTPRSMMANYFHIPEQLIATFEIEMRLLKEEECLPVDELRGVLRTTLEELFVDATTEILTVQVMSVVLDSNDLQCRGRRDLLRGLLSYSSATAFLEVMVAFAPAEFVAINLQHLANQQVINAIAGKSVSNIIEITEQNLAKNETYINPAFLGEHGEDSSKGMSTILIAVSTILGSLVCGLACYGSYWHRKSLLLEVPVTVVQTVPMTKVDELKADLALCDAD